MIAKRDLRALVVDDEAALRMLTIRELMRNGFTCDAARDGVQALELVASRKYDVVVTDLSMPEKNGHALAVELLGRENRPAVVILTGVTEPRLARDLIVRGVDDIIFKPVDQSVLAAKVRAIVDRRAALTLPAPSSGVSAELSIPSVPEASAPTQSLEALVVEPADLAERLAHFAKVVPISQAAIDVINMTNVDNVSVCQLVSAIELDASLAAEVLKIANSTFYNRTPRKVVDLHEAVLRIGQKRTGELALMMSAMGAASAGMFSWMDLGVAWRQSIAAGLAAECLIAQGGQASNERQLFLCSLMHPLGRIVLGSLYPDRYQAMLQFCNRNRTSLHDCEKIVFRQSHSEVLARLLEMWNIPSPIHEPLKHLGNRSNYISTLPEPLRTKVELIQVAVLMGKMAVGRWETWDRIELPTKDACRRLRVESPSDAIPLLKAELQAISDQSHLMAASPLRLINMSQPDANSDELIYCDLSEDSIDFLPEILGSMGVSVLHCAPSELAMHPSAVVSCVGASEDRIADVLTGNANHVVITDTADVEWRKRCGTLVTLPQSYHVLRSACSRAIRPKTVQAAT